MIHTKKGLEDQLEHYLIIVRNGKTPADRESAHSQYIILDKQYEKITGNSYSTNVRRKK
jgi:hypothetical protein